MPEERTTDVLVIGAGPAGLMLANWLAKCGVDAMVIDSKNGPTRESRAIVIQARSMEIFAQLGVVDTVLEQCSSATTLSPGFGRRRLGVVPIGELGRGVTPYPRLYVLEQSKTEAILVASLAARGRQVGWGQTLRTLHEHRAGGVVATAFSGDEEIVYRARYCVGADGSGSTVRRILGIPFPGTTDGHLFSVCDATGVRGLRSDEITVRLGDDDFLLTFPMSGEGHHRLIGIAKAPVATGRPHRGADAPSGRDAALITDDDVRPRVDRFSGVTWGESLWFATYRVHHRVASQFRRGSVFLVGDAAHVHSPVGAQGMNTGLQDAHNLALKLVDVFSGVASDASLDRYEAERRPVALKLVATTDRLFGFVTSGSRRARVARRVLAVAAVPVATRVIPRLRSSSRLFEYVSQVRVHYWMDAEAKQRAGSRRDPVIGRRLPYTGPNFESLGDGVWQVHEYGPVDPASVARLESALGVPVRVFPAAEGRSLSPGTFYLVRPDGFVAAASRTPGAAEVLRASLPDLLRG